MELLGQIWDIFVHLDVYLNAWAGTLGPWLYVLLFVIIFCETGLVARGFFVICGGGAGVAAGQPD